MEIGTKQWKRAVMLRLSIIGIALSILVLYYWHPSFTRKLSPSYLAADRQRLAVINASIDTPDANGAFIAKAKELREGWHVWALAHRSLLREMAMSDGKSEELLEKICAQIPSLPSVETCGIPRDEVSTGSPLPFTWNSGPMRRVDASSIKDPFVRGKFENGEESRLYMLRANFKREHDIELSQSVKTGAHQVVVWVSGRVTQLVYEQITDSNSNESTKTSYSDICPPYSDLGG